MIRQDFLHQVSNLNMTIHYVTVLYLKCINYSFVFLKKTFYILAFSISLGFVADHSVVPHVGDMLYLF